MKNRRKHPKISSEPKPSRRAMLLFVNYGPYHVARWRSTAAYFAARGVEVVPVQLAETEETYPWESTKATDGVPLVTLFPGRSYHTIAPVQAAYGMYRYLRQANPNWVAIPGYARLEFLVAAVFIKIRQGRAVLFSDSKKDDFPRFRPREWVKSRLVRLFDAALVGGRQAADYMARLGMPKASIFCGYDVVDNRNFAEQAKLIRENRDSFKRRYALPDQYFLSVGRFVPKKNFSLLLRAFARYRASSSKSGWHLVLCGAGPLEEALKAQARELGVKASVRFAGFRQVDELPVFYSLAGAFILASSHSEQWGLVVNEAMASGLPVVVSRACGCATDLVLEGVNGFTFDPRDEHSLARLLQKISSGTWDLEKMGLASQQIIQNWSPERFAANLWQAFDTEF